MRHSQYSQRLSYVALIVLASLTLNFPSQLPALAAPGPQPGVDKGAEKDRPTPVSRR